MSNSLKLFVEKDNMCNFKVWFYGPFGRFSEDEFAYSSCDEFIDELTDFIWKEILSNSEKLKDCAKLTIFIEIEERKKIKNG